MAQSQPSPRPHPASLGCPGQHNGEIPSGPSVVTRRLPSGTLGDPLRLTPPQAPCGSSPFPGPPQPHSPPGAGWGLSPAGSWGQCAGGGAPWEDSLGRTRWPDGLRSVPAPLSDPGPVSARWAVLTAPCPVGPTTRRPLSPAPRAQTPSQARKAPAGNREERGRRTGVSICPPSRPWTATRSPPTPFWSDLPAGCVGREGPGCVPATCSGCRRWLPVTGREAGREGGQRLWGSASPLVGHAGQQVQLELRAGCAAMGFCGAGPCLPPVTGSSLPPLTVDGSGSPRLPPGTQLCSQRWASQPTTALGTREQGGSAPPVGWGSDRRPAATSSPPLPPPPPHFPLGPQPSCLWPFKARAGSPSPFRAIKWTRKMAEGLFAPESGPPAREGRCPEWAGGRPAAARCPRRPQSRHGIPGPLNPGLGTGPGRDWHQVGAG